MFCVLCSVVFQIQDRIWYLESVVASVSPMSNLDRFSFLICGHSLSLKFEADH